VWYLHFKVFKRCNVFLRQIASGNTNNNTCDTTVVERGSLTQGAVTSRTADENIGRRDDDAKAMDDAAYEPATGRTPPHNNINIIIGSIT